MFTPISFASAIDFWKKFDNSKELPILKNNKADNMFSLDSRNQLISFAQDYGMDYPLHIMVPDINKRSLGDYFSTHLIPPGLPAGSFVRFSETISIICPELTFLLAARSMTVAELAVLACDLSGIYYLKESAEYGQSSRAPITSIEKINQYLTTAKGVKGVRKAQIAIQYALNNSNSPVESKMAATIILRYLYGGFSMEEPELNYMVKLSKEGAALLKREYCCCDIVWPDLKIVVEYDSDLAHLSANQVRYDKRRTTALQLSGYKVILVTRDYFSNFNSVETLFLLMQKAIGKDVNKRALERNKKVREETINKLFLTNPWV